MLCLSCLVRQPICTVTASHLARAPPSLYRKPVTDDPQRREALRTALSVFERFGYRKTSMENVAREIGVSRQGLYLWYPSKKALFSAVIDEWLRTQREAVSQALQAPDRETSLVDALDVLHGRYLDDPSSTREELLAAAKPLVGDRWLELTRWVNDQLAPLLPEPSHERAQVLLAASLGSKQEGLSRAAYRARMRLVVRLVAL